MSAIHVFKKQAISLLFVSLCLAGQPLPGDTAGFFFIQLSDTHWGEGDHLDRTKSIVTAIKNLPMKIECLVHTGDLTARTVCDTGALDSGLALLKSVNVPLHIVAGNHDIDKRHPETFAFFQKRCGPFLDQAEYHGVEFIFACVEPLADAFSIPGYEPIPALTAALKKADGKPCLLFIHTPPVADFYENSFHDTWPKRNREQFEDAIRPFGIIAIFAGHFHRGDSFEIGTTRLYVCPSVAGYFGRQASCRLVEYKKGKVNIISIYPSAAR
jgi:hypothetical protein